MEAGGDQHLAVMDRCRPWIAAALEYAGGTHTLQDIEDGIRAGQFLLWPGERGCLVTEIIDFPRKRVLNVWLGGGDMDQLKDMHDSVVAFARYAGCASVTITGRPGWARVWRDQGFAPAHVTLEKEIAP